MLLKDVCSIVDGKVLVGEERLEERVEYAFASDLMSDVLTVKRDNFLLITGLANIQLIRTAEMADAPFILLCRGKKALPEMIEIADENDMIIISSNISLFHCAGLLFEKGLKPIY